MSLPLALAQVLLSKPQAATHTPAPISNLFSFKQSSCCNHDFRQQLTLRGDATLQQVDVRPALDGFRDMADRLVQMPLARLTGKSHFVPLSFRPSPTMKVRVSKHSISIVSLLLFGLLTFRLTSVVGRMICVAFYLLGCLDFVGW